MMNSKGLSRSEGAECGTLLSFFGGEAGSNPPGLMPETRIAGPRSSASNRLVQGPCLGRHTVAMLVTHTGCDPLTLLVDADTTGCLSMAHTSMHEIDPIQTRDMQKPKQQPAHRGL